MRPVSRLLLASLLVGSSACAGWVRQPIDPSSPPPESSEFQVWSHDSAYLVHALRVDRDTLTGVVTRSDENGSRRVAIAMAEVDSTRIARTGEPDPGLLLGLVVVGTYLILLLVGHGN
jgi:hypothetical protein